MGTSAIKQEPLKGDGDWAQALKDAPKDTLPRLVVNSKTDAIPVTVVNFKDMETTAATTKGMQEKANKEAAQKTPKTTVDIVSKVEVDTSELKKGFDVVS